MKKTKKKQLQRNAIFLVSSGVDPENCICVPTGAAHFLVIDG